MIDKTIPLSMARNLLLQYFCLSLMLISSIYTPVVVNMVCRNMGSFSQVSTMR